MTVRLRALGLLVSLQCTTGCANDASAPVRAGQDAVVLPVDAGKPGMACSTVLRGATGTGCIGTWQCASPDPRQFLCAASDGGLSCACTQGDASVRATTDLGCSNESDVSALAQRLCGWDVP